MNVPSASRTTTTLLSRSLSIPARRPLSLAPLSALVHSSSSYRLTVTRPRTMATESSISPAPEGRQPVSLPPSLTIEEMIHLKLSDAFQPSYLSIRNDSSKHSHHAPMKVPGAATGQTHFFVHCVSPAFEGKTRIARHRLVNQALESEFARGLHALSLKLETEKESTA